jgi:lipooligosaccharide transport system permease protein
MTDAATSAPAPGPGDGGPDLTLDELRSEALESGRRARRLGTLYVAEHIVRAMRAYGWTIVVGALGQPILYLLGLAAGLAALIGGPITDSWGQQVTYLTFVAPALLMTAGIQVASEEFSYPVMDGFKWRRYFFGFSASPISPAQIATGVLFGATARVVVATAGYYLFIWLFFTILYGGMPQPAVSWLAIPIGVLGAWSFGAPLMAYAASLKDDRGQFAMVQRFIFMPMFLFSGTFYPLTSLPVWLQWIGWISPLWHATELGRVVMYGAHEPVWLTAVHVVYLAALSLTGYLLARRAFARRLGE